VPGRIKSFGRKGGKGFCGRCACGQGLLVLLLWRGRRRHGPKKLGCLAVLLGLAGLLLVLLRRRGKRDRFEPPGPPPPGRGEPVRQRVPSTIYRRPDPLIYSQGYLMSQGIAVTWDNPDIQLEKGGVPVSSHALEPDTDYEIVARVWNGSTQAPAVELPVRCSYLEFGIGTISHPIGMRTVDLPVKGAPGSPATARIPWTTPMAPGHYCIQVELVWLDDANPANNLGQENTDVKALNSPQANWVVPVRNDSQNRRRLRLELDAYEVGRPPRCPPAQERGTPPPGEREREERRRRARARHTRGAHPVPEGWTVTVDPVELMLSPGEGSEVQVGVTAPDGFRGRQAFNLSALAGEELVGGVTLIAEGEA
jgi:hypothetical protein